jgi:hypothetical protein
MEWLARYQGVLVFAVGMVVSVAVWMLRASIRQELHDRTAGAASQTAVKALDERLDAHESRLTSMETALRHLPTAEQITALNLALADLRGEVRTFGAKLEGVEKIVSGTSRRVELIDEHLKRGGA